MFFPHHLGRKSGIIWHRLSFPWPLRLPGFHGEFSTWSLKLIHGVIELPIWGTGSTHCTGWWFQTFFTFTPAWWNDPIWRAYFSDGLVQPPTSFGSQFPEKCMKFWVKVIHHEKLLMEKKSETSMRSVSFEGEKGIDAGGLLRDWCLDLPIKIGGDLGWLETTKRWRFWYLGLFWSGQNNDDLSQGHLKWCFTEGIPSKSLI